MELTPSGIGTRSPNHFQESCNKFMANGLNSSLTACVIKRIKQLNAGPLPTHGIRHTAGLASAREQRRSASFRWEVGCCLFYNLSFYVHVHEYKSKPYRSCFNKILFHLCMFMTPLECGVFVILTQQFIFPNQHHAHSMSIGKLDDVHVFVIQNKY